VRGISTQTFYVSTGIVTYKVVFICSILCAGVVVEFKETNYSVLESDRVFNVTLVKQGNPEQDIVVYICTKDNTTNGKSIADFACIITDLE